MAIYVKEYDWMWLSSGLNLSPAECRVYAYIYGLTESKNAKIKGYNGSVRQLARTLGLSLGMTSTVLRNMQEKQLIILRNGVYRTVQSVNDSVQSSNDSVQSMNNRVQSVNENVQPAPPRTPININKEKVRDNKKVIYNIKDYACDTIDTHNPSTPSSFVKPSVQPLSSFDQRSVATAQPASSFDELLVAYKSQNANVNPSADLLTAARNLWDDLPDYRQQQILDALQAGSWNKPRLDWLISDFKFREPTNYLGKEQPRGYSYYFAWHNGARGLYIKQDVDAFHMSNPEHFMDL